MCHKYKYEGSWSKVDEALQLDLIPYLQLCHFLETRTLEDFFGNDIRLLKKVIRRFNVYNPYIPKTSKVKRPQRKRGYDDKGHLGTGLPLDLVPTRENYPFEERYHKDSTFRTLPEIYKRENNIFQAGLVEKHTSMFLEDLYEKEQKEEALREKQRKVKSKEISSSQNEISEENHPLLDSMDLF